MKSNVTFFETKLEYRSEGKQPVLAGLVIPYDEWSKPIYGMFKEKFAPGAFRSYLSGNPDVLALREHNPQHILGRTSSGTLRLKETDRGVFCEVDVPNTSYANDLVESVRRQDINGMSFYFESLDENEQWGKEDGMRTRTITQATMKEVTFTSCPFYEGTNAQLRSLDAMTKEEVEVMLKHRAELDFPKKSTNHSDYLTKKKLLLMGQD